MAELFKFRCSACGTLLGAPARKVGRPIHCPRCGAEQTVPQPKNEPNPEAFDEDQNEPEDEGEDALDLGIDFGLAGASPLRPTVAPKPAPLIESPDVGKFVDEFLRAAPSGLEGASPTEDDDPETDDEPPAEPVVATPPEPLLPGPKPRGRRAPTVGPRAGRDVVLPRTAVVAWSLFALLALGLSFVAGLLVGHYRWR